ncbi:MAG: hypothetical protein A2Y12_19190 [Planctomycetes bacterium GWF2_42_9]|nr:MAG: hypothetical protein A2Y12_19190 [Planctomycetes bacterium GWF2_42_9]
MGNNTRRNGDPFWELQQRYRSERSLPANWESLDFFKEISDRRLLEKTCGKFPRVKSMVCLTGSDHHPVLLLKRAGNFSFRFCPCSTKKQGNYSYIPAKTTLELAPTPFHKHGYICHNIFINLPPENDMVGQENFFGIVRENDIIGDQYKEGMQ